LTEAGIRDQRYLAVVVALKVAGAALLALVWWWLAVFNTSPVVQGTTIVFAFMLGSYAPELMLTRLAAKRKLRLERGFPDALDLLVVCFEAGLAMPQAITEISRVLHQSEPDIAEEFAITAAELRVLADRTVALDNLAKRTGIASLRTLTTTLGQSLRFGTSLADSLRTLGADMRAARMARIDESAARLPVLLSLPLMLLLMPALLLVIGGPVALKIADLIAGGGP
jgi:tight adherence protein C